MLHGRSELDYSRAHATWTSAALTRLASLVVGSALLKAQVETLRMIARIWHGWTTTQNADAYEALLRTEVFPGILAKQIVGFERIELFRRPFVAADEVEFMTVMWFTTLDAVKSFVGEDYEAAYVPAAARTLLTRYDHRSRHYEVRERQGARPHSMAVEQHPEK